jgi:hypothetical protein
MAESLKAYDPETASQTAITTIIPKFGDGCNTFLIMC